MHGIQLRLSGIGDLSSSEIGERYYEPLKHIHRIIQIIHPRVTPANILLVAFKIINYTIG